MTSNLPADGPIILVGRDWNLLCTFFTGSECCSVQAMIDSFKYKTEWEENHMVGVHVRRGDLTIYGKNVRYHLPQTAAEEASDCYYVCAQLLEHAVNFIVDCLYSFKYWGNCQYLVSLFCHSLSNRKNLKRSLHTFNRFHHMDIVSP